MTASFRAFARSSIRKLIWMHLLKTVSFVVRKEWKSWRILPALCVILAARISVPRDSANLQTMFKRSLDT